MTSALAKLANLKSPQLANRGRLSVGKPRVSFIAPLEANLILLARFPLSVIVLQVPVLPMSVRVW